MFVFVLNRHSIPLMPCWPAKARKLLQDEKAQVVRRNLVKTTKGIGFVQGKRSSGQFALMDLFGIVVSAAVNIKKGCVRLATRTSTLIYGGRTFLPAVYGGENCAEI
jgi:hypothetical protein